MKQPALPILLATASLVLVACGGSDSSDESRDTASADAGNESDPDTNTDGDESSGDASGSSGLDGAREAPCDVIPVTVVNEALGATFEATPDEFGEAICQYSSGDVSFGIAWGPNFGGSVRSNFERSEDDGIEIDGLGDFAYRYQNLELAVDLNGDAISIQGGLDMETQGVALAEAIIAELE